MMYRGDCEQVTQRWSVTAFATNALITGAEDAIFCQGKVFIDKNQAGRGCMMTHDMLAFLHASATQLKSIVSIPDN